ncbi:MAG: hypothetical protein BZ137_06745, partial [Methanosphaera sp. rholeuAM130]
MTNAKKTILFITCIIMLIGISAVNAQEVSDDATSLELTDNTPIYDNDIDDTVINTNDKTSTDNSLQTASAKEKNIKSDSSIDITNSNYDQLSNYMNQYSTLNFADDFDGKTIDITNGVTITSSPGYTFTNSHFIVN